MPTSSPVPETRASKLLLVARLCCAGPHSLARPPLPLAGAIILAKMATVPVRRGYW